MNAVTDRPSVCLTHEELVQITGYKMASCQLADLKKQGFYRARRNALGVVVLERDHYTAVCAGRAHQEPPDQPTLRPPRLRAAA